MSLGSPDSNGIGRYAASTPRSPFHTMLNLGLQAVSDAITAVKALAGLQIRRPATIAFTGTTASIRADNVVQATACSEVRLNGVFDGSVDDYEIVIIGSTAVSATLDLRLLTSGTASAASYRRLRLSGVGSTASSLFVTDAAQLVLSATAAAADHEIRVQLHKPAAAVDTWGSAESAVADNPLSAAAAVSKTVWRHEVSAAYDGVQVLTSAGAFTGTIEVRRK